MKKHRIFKTIVLCHRLLEDCFIKIFHLAQLNFEYLDYQRRKIKHKIKDFQPQIDNVYIIIIIHYFLIIIEIRSNQQQITSFA